MKLVNQAKNLEKIARPNFYNENFAFYLCFSVKFSYHNMYYVMNLQSFSNMMVWNNRCEIKFDISYWETREEKIEILGGHMLPFSNEKTLVQRSKLNSPLQRDATRASVQREEWW